MKIPAPSSAWTAPTPTAALALVLAFACLTACGGGTQEEPVQTVAQTTPQPAFDPNAPLEETPRCASDAECVATQFDDCCADNAGHCPCEWHATTRAWLEAEQLECGAEECTDGACPTCPPASVIPSARCVDTVCVLDW